MEKLDLEKFEDFKLNDLEQVVGGDWATEVFRQSRHYRDYICDNDNDGTLSDGDVPAPKIIRRSYSLKTVTLCQ